MDNDNYDDLGLKKAPVSQIRPNPHHVSLTRKPSDALLERSQSSSPFSQENAIDKIRKESRWPPSWNREWYLGLPQDIRVIVAHDVVAKFAYMDWYARDQDYDMLSNDFAHSELFRLYFSNVINAIRFDNQARLLRSKLDNPDTDG